MPQLERKLGTYACISIVAGAVIGSSIFMKPATMAAQTGSPIILLAVWVVAGIISLFGGMINAEIGCMLPKTGGQYVYFRHMYGEFFAFLYGWAGFIVINTAAIAAIAFVFAAYTEYFITLPRFPESTEMSVEWIIPFVGKIYPLKFVGIKALAIIVIFIITAVNYVSLRFGAAVQLFFTVIKVAALLLLTGIIFFSGKGSTQHFITPATGADFSTWGIIVGFVAATSGALAAYDGWNNLGFVAGEIKDPRKNIPRGLFIGIGICILMYVLTNQAYLYMLPVEEMQRSNLVAADALAKLGMGGAALIALLVMLSTIGATNGNILPCARVIYAMGEEKKFPSWAGKVHPRFHTPGNALWLQCVWACVFVLTGSFDMLTDMFVFITWIFYGFAAYGIFILRRKMKPSADKEEQLYRTWGYPVVPIIFIAFAALYFVLTIYNDVTNYTSGKAPVINSVLGLLLTGAGVPVYYYFKRKQGRDDNTNLKHELHE
ncbi:MAG: amino acid permease [Chitinophagaceae bacterium]